MAPGWIALGFLIAVAIGAPLWWLSLRSTVRRERLAERRARDAHRLAEIGALTSGLAHEIKNPLSTIGLNAELLAEAVEELDVEPQDRDRVIRRVSVLRREVERLRDILETFLRFAGELRLDPRPTDLNQVVDELADFYLPQAQRYGVRLRVALSPAPVEASVDAGHLKQAILNLMINASQAMEQLGRERADRRSRASGGGSAAGSGDGEAPLELILRTENGRDETGPVAVIHVTDTGPGIDQERLDRLFEPYFTTKSGGTGLGLSISRRIVEEHGGRISVHSEPGKGADFTITLPQTS